MSVLSAMGTAGRLHSTCFSNLMALLASLVKLVELVALTVAETPNLVVIDHPYRLHERIADCRAHKLEALLFQGLAHSFRQISPAVEAKRRASAACSSGPTPCSPPSPPPPRVTESLPSCPDHSLSRDVFQLFPLVDDRPSVGEKCAQVGPETPMLLHHLLHQPGGSKTPSNQPTRNLHPHRSPPNRMQRGASLRIADGAQYLPAVAYYP